jgi:hypothetical protein
LHDSKDVTARCVSTGAKQVAYILTNLEFMIAHVIARPFATLTVARKYFHRSAHWVAHVDGSPPLTITACDPCETAKAAFLKTCYRAHRITIGNAELGMTIVEYKGYRIEVGPVGNRPPARSASDIIYIAIVRRALSVRATCDWSDRGGADVFFSAGTHPRR